MQWCDIRLIAVTTLPAFLLTSVTCSVTRTPPSFLFSSKQRPYSGLPLVPVTSSVLNWKATWTFKPLIYPCLCYCFFLTSYLNYVLLKLLLFYFLEYFILYWSVVDLDGFPGGTKEHACQCRRCRNKGLIPGLGRSPRGGHGNPLRYSCLENSMDPGAWQACP